MVGPSKILTVSYGTFSCTLEGFDDPFSTMRGIAEYFRDLAADDRYFGAEPPTPDAEMLHRIAEREIHRRVEARVENNGIILRQMDDEGTDHAAAPAASGASLTAAGLAAATSAPAAESQAETYEFTDAAPVRGESVAAKLARIRAAVAHREDDAGQSYRDDSHVTDTLPTAKLTDAFGDTADAAQAQQPQTEDAVQVQPAAAESPAVEDEPVNDDAVNARIAQDEDVEDEPLELNVPEPDTETADATDADDVEVDADLEEPETLVLSDTAETDDFEDDVLLAEEDDLDDAASDEGASTDDFEQAELEPETLTGTSFEDVDQAEIEEDADRDMAALEEAPDADEEASDEEETSNKETPDTAAMTRVLGQMADITDDELSVDDRSEEEDVTVSDDETENESEAPAMIRVLKMRRPESDEAEPVEEADETAADAEETVEQDEDEGEIADFGLVDETEEDTDETAENVFSEDEDDAELSVEPEHEDEQEAALSDEAEPEDELSEDDDSELMATLAQVQRQSDAENRAEKEGRAVLERQDLDDNGNGVKRLLDVTNTELEETEGTRRRSAIQHLKAAVMATRFDKKLGKKKATEEDVKEMDQYRDDLARVVRPRRPVDTGKPTERRQAPLVLVSEQRVTEPVAPVDPNAEAVRPRRVSAGAEDAAAEPTQDSEENIFSDVDSFADFAEQMDATELPDILEAAAAYASYVEGRPHFSRPQIMRAIAMLDDDGTYSREDSLRSFGRLLRSGKIRKLGRGQFTVAQSTRFNPGARAAGE